MRDEIQRPALVRVVVWELRCADGSDASFAVSDEAIGLLRDTAVQCTGVGGSEPDLPGVARRAGGMSQTAADAAPVRVAVAAPRGWPQARLAAGTSGNLDQRARPPGAPNSCAVQSLAARPPGAARANSLFSEKHPSEPGCQTPSLQPAAAQS